MGPVFCVTQEPANQFAWDLVGECEECYKISTSRNIVFQKKAARSFYFSSILDMISFSLTMNMSKF